MTKITVQTTPQEARELAVATAYDDSWMSLARDYLRSLAAQLTEAQERAERFNNRIIELLESSLALRAQLAKVERAKTYFEADAHMLRANLERVERAQVAQGFQIRFDGPPSHESGRFVEVETLDGKSFKLGEWVQDGDYWLLRVAPLALRDEPPAEPKEDRDGE